jgi:gliding motility-associated protein GldE
LLGIAPYFLLLSVNGSELLLGVLGIVLLLCCSALISGSEVAYFSLNHEDFKQLKAEESVNAARILRLKDQPRRLLATILISNNFINIAIVILSDFVLQALLPAGIFEEWATAMLSLFSAPSTAQVVAFGRFISFLITVAGVTFLLVLFGEVAPKVYAKINNRQLALLMAHPLSVLMTVFSPMSSLLVSSTHLIEKRLASRATSANTSREEIDEAIELTVRQEQGARRDIDILKSIVKFGDVTVKQIMRSRVDVVAVDFRIGFNELQELIRDSGYSRIPVYENDFDNVTGILYVKDLLGYLDEPDEFEWQELIRTDVYYVPEAKKINDLLKEFQQERLHMAIVVDEYGGSSGIVTLEDIMEEIIGEIKDEFDDEVEVVYKKIDDYNYLFEGKTLLNDVCRIVGIDTNTFDEVKGEADSLAGLILEIQGTLPKVDSEMTYDRYQFKIVSVNKRRIEQILFTLIGGQK